MDAIKCLKKRRSIRSYKQKEIPEDIIKDIIDCARLAPTANNIQPWEFIVIKNKEILKKLSEITDYGFFIKDAYFCVVVICKYTKYYLEDGSAATENILLAAKSYDLGSCWVAGDKKEYAEEILKLLNVPNDYKLISLIPIGYPSEEINPYNKRNLDEVLHWEKF